MSYITIVASTCRPEVEEKFNKWYNEVHVPMILKSPWIKGATRYKVVTQSPDCPKYLAIYEFEDKQKMDAHDKSPEMAAAIAELRQSWKGDDMKIIWRIQYESTKTWRK